ncbi:heme-binding protein [Jiangella sp. DSM 45060]|uniref:GlcG/HbpS family heme-binding protein n=1 Tax=Jiangella sp. DSM 45060 TaxID=1798224 RepID=UPI00087B70DF|nr:heme-binding protein [Jiangella sp. DSM 45060]SDT46465.1 Uncharacterized conserved protein GlcG, DUF336 family [Jiangella sp. DSM 45060]
MTDLLTARAQLTSAACDAILAAVREAAARQGLAVTVAVVDESAVLRASHRMDGTPLVSVELAMKKAKTAARTRRSTADWWALLAGNDELRWAATTAIADLAIFGGGVVLTDDDGTVVGGLGVSGATQEQDTQLADAGRAVLESQPRADPA